MIKKHKMFVLFSVFLLLFGILSCDQAPIFYNISLEPAPLIPYVGGTPTKMVVVDVTLYVGSVNNNKIYRFSSGVWNAPVTLPAGHTLMALAGTDDALAALVMTGNTLDSLTIIEYDPNNMDAPPQQIGRVSGYSIQTIFGAGGEFFAGLKRDGADSYAIYRVDGSSLVEISPAVSGGLLVGAAETKSGNIYLATQKGVYLYNTTVNPVPIGLSASSKITGIIAYENTVIAVSDNGNTGNIFVLNSIGTSFDPHTEGPIFTGGLGVKENTPGNPTLLLGVLTRTASSEQGFRELSLDADGRPDSSTIVNPGSTDPKLRASIGLRPVMHIMQVPPSVQGTNFLDSLIFAATSTRGLWSYRGGEWNAETQDR